MLKQLVTIRIITWNVRAFIEYLTVKKKSLYAVAQAPNNPGNAQRKKRIEKKRKKKRGRIVK